MPGAHAAGWVRGCLTKAGYGGAGPLTQDAPGLTSPTAAAREVSTSASPFMASRLDSISVRRNARYDISFGFLRGRVYRAGECFVFLSCGMTPPPRHRHVMQSCTEPPSNLQFRTSSLQPPLGPKFPLITH